MRLKEGGPLHNIKVQSKAANAGTEAAASCPANLAQIIKETSTLNNRV